MVEIQVLDETTVQVGGQSLTGPLHVFGESCTVAGNSFSRGYVVVNAGTAVEQLPFTVRQAELLPYSVCLVFFLGLLWARFGLSR